MNDSIPKWVRKYIGIPFVERGRCREGADCWGLVRMVYIDQFGVTVPSFSDDYMDIKRDRNDIQSSIQKNSAKLFSEISEDIVSVKDGVVVLLHERGLPLHVAFYIGCDGGERYVLHTTSARGHSYRERLHGNELEHSNPRFFRYRSGVYSMR